MTFTRAIRLAAALTLAVGLLPATSHALPAPYGAAVTPQVAAYSVPAGLQGAKHLNKAPGLSAAQRTALQRVGFVVTPDSAEQMFLLYESYGENEELGPIPNYITTDSVLQAYHTFFDFSLRTVEQDHLIRLLTLLTQQLTGLAARDVAALDGTSASDAARANLGYFLVARALLTGQAPSIQADLPGKSRIIEAADADLQRIAAHAGRFPSAVLGRTVHFDQFAPRGHYTRSEDLSRYFRAMMWYGLPGFELDSPAAAPRHTLQALLMVRALAGNSWLAGLWERIYAPTRLFVGISDDLTWQQYAPLATQVFGAGLPLDALTDAARLDAFLARARATMPEPRIAPAFLEADETGALENVPAAPQGRQFRFMGQRFIPDSRVMQELVYPKVGPDAEGSERYWPMGLDVMAALGSARARELLVSRYHQDRYRGYLKQLDAMTAELAAYTEEQWLRNLYWAWLYSLKPLLQPRGAGYPTFMRSDAWLDRNLVTTQGSWAQLRHDTILYGKSSGAELGGPDEKAVQGYVDPYPEVFGRLAYLARMSRDELRRLNVLPGKLAESYSRFGSMLLFLKDCADKQLTSQRLSVEAYERIQWFGGELERLTLDVVEGGENMTSWFNIENATDRHMATIADVHTSFGECLEVGVGQANRLYVIVPCPGGGLQLAKGGVMSYYEFRQPVSDRLTDEKWIEMLGAGAAPAMPDWTRSFLVP